MLEQKDIDEAKKLFRMWDLQSIWHKPSLAFREHTRKKAKDSLALALYLLEKIEKTNELEENDTVTLWIVTQSYYSMFFEAEYLLAIDGKKLPDDINETHKKIYLAFLYYYLIKGSELEQKKPGKMTSSRMSRVLALFKEMQDETLELQRIQKSITDLKKEREERNAFTYQMSRTAERSEARMSTIKAIEFRTLIEEYILARQQIKTGSI